MKVTRYVVQFNTLYEENNLNRYRGKYQIILRKEKIFTALEMIARTSVISSYFAAFMSFFPILRAMMT